MPAAATEGKRIPARRIAYGFRGGMFVDRSERSGYVYMIGGTGADPDLNRDPKSGLSIWEDPLGGALEEALSSI